MASMLSLNRGVLLGAYLQSSSLNNIIGCPNYEGALHHEQTRLRKLLPDQWKAARAAAQDAASVSA
jgi:hypothetical protein